MPIALNDLFKFVSLRRPETALSVDPSEIAPGSIALKLLSDMRVDVANPQPEVLAKLGDVPLLDEPALRELTLERVASAINAETVNTVGALRAIRIEIEERQVPLAQVASTDTFRDEYRRVFDTWIVGELRRSGSLAATLTRLLRAGYLAHRLRSDPDALREPGAIDRLRNARLQMPKAWSAARYRQAEVLARHARVLPTRAKVTPSPRTVRLQELRARHAELVQRIVQREVIQKQVHNRYFALLRADAPTRPGVTPLTRSIALSDEFYAQVTNRLEATHQGTFSAIVDLVPGGRPVDINDLVDILTPSVDIELANKTCAEIRAIEESEGDSLPVATAPEETSERPMVSAMGWGDLVVARERLTGYTAREIAHIENVLTGESKLREHERLSKTEQIEETETITETESEKDSQTTDRYELQSQSQETIQQDFSIASGINTSGRYGLTRVETSLDAAFEQSKSQSRSSSINTAREIVSRAVERTFESVRRLRRLTITEQIRELNRHELSNARVAGDAQPPVPISGMYVWVEKIHEVELRHYGTRLMLEFHVPEPALSLLEQGTQSKRRRRLPPFASGPAQVNSGNYMCLAERYGAQDIVPPPAQYINVGFAWSSTPSEEAEEWAEDALSDMVAIPDGYRPISGTAIASMLREGAPEAPFDVYVAVGGVSVIDQADEKGFARRDFELLPATPFPGGVPVSARAKGHFDKTMVIQILIRCEREPEATAKWQLRTWEQLRAGYDGLARRLDRDLQQVALHQNLLVSIDGRPEAENRRMEREELQKWAIKAMRLKPHNFNAVEQVGDMQEISPLNADMQAPIVRFFEEAFEWDQMSYFLFPYYWARRESWAMRNNASAVDARFKAFLGAGAARVIVAVTPGYEARVLSYLESDPEQDELARIQAPAGDEMPAGTSFEDLWLELLTDRKEDLGLGSGTLAVEHGERNARINDDSNWDASPRDLGRELYIGGERYVVAAVNDERDLQLDRSYEGTTDGAARYAAGSVPFGPPWLVNVPTSLVVLAENRPALEAIVQPGS